MNQKKLISICVPVLNEESNIKLLYEQLTKVINDEKDKYNFEIIFTDNHSTDNTWELIKAISIKDPMVKGLRFSRNFGFQRSILFNYQNSKGDAVVQIDADLQDPPHIIQDFLRKWEDGFLVVYGVRKTRKENVLLTSFRKFGYWLIDFLSDHPIPRNAGDFRLMDRLVLEELLKFKDYSPYIRGSISWLGFKQIGVDYNRQARSRGKSKFSLFQLTKLGLDGLFNNSIVPLRFGVLIGIISIIISILGSIYFVLSKIFLDLPEGLATTNILILFSIGINSLFLGIMGEYIGKIFLTIKGGSIAIIQEKINFD
ncbi:MAG: glycosyltransferase family 2 protein [Chloroflexota bacterium]|nr:glycosyltransferase family 2 protein [Chloroflexota bacterium]